jgi:hypothetical protein
MKASLLKVLGEAVAIRMPGFDGLEDEDDMHCRPLTSPFQGDVFC